MTDCPVCKNEVPAGAPRCKHCFNDLTEHWEGGGGPSITGPIIGAILLTLLMTAAVGWVYTRMHGQGQLGLVTLDPREERMVLVYTSTEEPPETRQVYYRDIASIEMEAGSYLLGGNHWSVFVVTTAGDRVLINRSEASPLDSYANTIAQHTNKQLTMINNIKAGSDMRGL